MDHVGRMSSLFSLTEVLTQPILLESVPFWQAGMQEGKRKKRMMDSSEMNARNNSGPGPISWGPLVLKEYPRGSLPRQPVIPPRIEHRPDRGQQFCTIERLFDECIKVFRRAGDRSAAEA